MRKILCGEMLYHILNTLKEVIGCTLFANSDTHEGSADPAVRRSSDDALLIRARRNRTYRKTQAVKANNDNPAEDQRDMTRQMH